MYACLSTRISELEQRCFSKHTAHTDRRNQPWPSNSSEWGTKYVFRVHLAQIRSAVPEIFHTQTKMSQTVPETEPYAVHCV